MDALFVKKEALRKCSSDPTARSNKLAPVSKCVVTLDGYSYVIVASAPKDGAKEEVSSGKFKTTNGDSPTATADIPAQLKSAFGRVRTKPAAAKSQISISSSDPQLDSIDLENPSAVSPCLNEACENASLRLKCLLRLLQKGAVSVETLRKNLQLAAEVLDSVYCEEEKKIVDCEQEDELSEVRPDLVPEEVRAWLATTFTRQLHASQPRRSAEDKPRFRSVAQAIRAGIFVERIYRRMSSSSSLQFPSEVTRYLKMIDDWTFDVFGLSDACGASPLRYLGIDLLNRYGITHKFKISGSTLENFLNLIESGYCKYRNLYHNNTHASDVAQTVHYILCQSGLMNWLTDLEMFAVLFAAIIHDYEHTGTTNNFHVMSNSETAILYNDRAVLENHHISAAFRMLKDEDANILSNLTRDEYREFRSLVIDMVLATDMSGHFQQIKSAKSMLNQPEISLEKSKILSLVLHCCDVAHPSKPWPLHRRWTDLLLEEFFRQGDLEKELGLPYSPLCDRNSTLVAQSQIGFIEFIVEPSMTVMGDLLEKILVPQSPRSRHERGSITEEVDSSSSFSADASQPASKASPRNAADQRSCIQRPWDLYLEENKAKWRELEHAESGM